MKKNLLFVFILFINTFIHAQTSQVLFGVTSAGGAFNQGVLFYYNPATGTITKKHDFANGSTNGGVPIASLIKATNGLLYGATSQGGGFNFGTLFSFNPATSVYTTIYQFDGGSNGSAPYGTLMQASNGKLYGMTSAGGGGYGNIFEYNISTSSLSSLISFMSSNDGNTPWATNLIQATDGKLYGMTYNGGGLGYGEIFSFTYSPLSYSNLYAFDYSTSGTGAFGSLIQASDGKMYGMNSGGGANSIGTLFQFNSATSALTTILDFDGTLKGASPSGDVVQAIDGMLYGMTAYGGTNSGGVLFQYNPTTSVFTKKHDFSTANGINPQGSLRQASDGNLYGMTNSGGANSMGVLFQYNPTTSTYTKKIDFNGTNGANPVHTYFVQAPVTLGIDEHDMNNHFNLYPNPSNGKFSIVANNPTNISDGKVEVFNVVGKMIYNEKFSDASKIEIDLSNYSSGMYFLKIYENDKIYNGKVIIE